MNELDQLFTQGGQSSFLSSISFFSIIALKALKIDTSHQPHRGINVAGRVERRETTSRSDRPAFRLGGKVLVWSR